jgi:hypothetical protein
MEDVKLVWNKSLGPAARRQARTLSLRCQRFWCKDKGMENGHASPLSPALRSAAPQVIFANRRETLHLLKLGRGLKFTCTQAIEGYLYPGAGTSWEWHWLFPSRQVMRDPHSVWR